MTHPTPEQFFAQRAQVTQDFTAKAKQERTAFEANPAAFDLQQAIRIVGVEQALALFQTGKLRA